jgi:hypothetical protein
MSGNGLTGSEGEYTHLNVCPLDHRFHVLDLVWSGDSHLASHTGAARNFGPPANFAARGDLPGLRAPAIPKPPMGRLKPYGTLGPDIAPAKALAPTGEGQRVIFAFVVDAQLQLDVCRG